MKNIVSRLFVVVTLACSCIVSAGAQEKESASTQGSSAKGSSTKDSKGDMKQKIELKKEKLGTTKNVSRFGNVYLAGQFSQNDIKLLKDKGIKTVITLRRDKEVDWNEKQKLADAGIKLIKVPFSGPDSLDDKVFDQVRKAFKDAAKQDKDAPLMLHCGSANRVGAVWAAHRALDQKVELEDAIEEAKKVGLRTAEYIPKVKDYVKRQQMAGKK